MHCMHQTKPNNNCTSRHGHTQLQHAATSNKLAIVAPNNTASCIDPESLCNEVSAWAHGDTRAIAMATDREQRQSVRTYVSVGKTHTYSP
jgi:hypothetical protein